MSNINYIDHNSYCLQISAFKNNSSVGSAAVITNDNTIILKKKFKLPCFCSAFQALLIAIQKTMMIIDDKDWRSKNITISTQSIAVINALRDINTTNNIICDIFDLIHKLRQKRINFNLHNDREQGYSIVNQLAREAAVAHLSFAYDLVPQNYIKSKIKEKTIDKWEERWQRSTTGGQTKQFFQSEKGRKCAKNHFKPDFYTTQALTNHGSSVKTPELGQYELVLLIPL
jgi:hypothetical protein